MPSLVVDYTQVTNRYMSDEFIIRRLAEDKWYGGSEPRLSIAKLEKRARLRPLPSDAVPAYLVKRAVGNVPSTKLESSSQTFKKQIESLLSEIEVDQKQQFEYFISRLVAGHLPRSAKWAIHKKDLDHFTSALFIINTITSLIPRTVDWIMISRGGDETDKYQSRPARLVPRSDSTLIPADSGILQRAKDAVLAPGFQPLRQFCSRRSRKTIPISLKDELEEAGDSTGSATRYDLSVLDLVLTERYISNMTNLGCRYRWVMTDRARNYFQSEGLITRYDLYSLDSLAAPERLRIISRDFGYSSFDDIRDDRERKRVLAKVTRSLKNSLDIYGGMEGITAHLEPLGTKEPVLPVGASSFTTEHEIVSYRMDLFDNKQMRWIYAPWSNPSQWTTGTNKWNPHKTAWLMRDTTTMKREDWQMSEQDVQLLFSLLANRGSHDFRHMLLKLLGLSYRLRTLSVDRLIQDGIAEVLYHPSLEYSGFQGGLLVVLPASSPKNVKLLLAWLLGAMPYVHAFWSEAGSLLAMLRIPGYAAFTASFLRGFLRNELLGLDSRDDLILGIIRDESTYNLSLPARLYNPDTRRLNNPYEARPTSRV